MAASYTAERKAGTGTTDGSSQFTFSPATNCTTGSTLYLIVSGLAVTAVTDTVGANTWTIDHSNTVTANRHWSVVSCYQATGLLTSATVTVTTDGATSLFAYWFEEFAGNYSSKDKEVDGVGSTTTLPTGTTAATSDADEVAIAVYATNQTSGTLTKNANYTNFTTGVQTATRQHLSDYRLLVATGTQNADATHSNMASSNNGIVTYKAVTGFIAPAEKVILQAMNRATNF